ncbi:hypothetical protein ACFWI9_11845, partial [Streptomyces sp. NPDC127084]
PGGAPRGWGAPGGPGGPPAGVTPPAAPYAAPHARTDRVLDRLLADGTVWISGSTWHGRRVMRISVSNWSTTDEDVARALDAIRRAAAS